MFRLLHIVSLLTFLCTTAAAAPHEGWRNALSQFVNSKTPIDSSVQQGYMLDDQLPQAANQVVLEQSVVPVTDTSVTRDLLAQYSSDIVLRFYIEESNEAYALNAAAEVLFLDVWNFAHNHVDIRLPIGNIPSLLALLPGSLHDNYVKLMDGLDIAIAVGNSRSSEHPLPSHLKRYRANSSPSGRYLEDAFFREYRPWSIIVPWMRLLASMFSSHTRLVTIGHSHENREILAFRVGVHPTNDHVVSQPRKVIIVTGGSHAREWITISTVSYAAYSFIVNYGRDPTITRLVEDYDWIFIPTINPDGYVHAWMVDRLWRKNRQPTPLSFCKGIDLDRTWSSHWDEANTSRNPCSETYAGEESMSGVEAKALASWVRNETTNRTSEIVSFVDLHSYSQQILLPYSYSCQDLPPTLEALEELGHGLARAIKRTHQYEFSVMRACRSNSLLPLTIDNTEKAPRLQTAGGSPLDWFYDVMRVRAAFQLKLRDTGSYGFLLPKEFIVPSGEEIFNALTFLGDALKDTQADLIEGDIVSTQLEKG